MTEHSKINCGSQPKQMHSHICISITGYSAILRKRPTKGFVLINFRYGHIYYHDTLYPDSANSLTE